eukprot:366071-Chlamydomonas_euryale.AAC.12
MDGCLVRGCASESSSTSRGAWPRHTSNLARGGRGRMRFMGRLWGRPWLDEWMGEFIRISRMMRRSPDWWGVRDRVTDSRAGAASGQALAGSADCN